MLAVKDKDLLNTQKLFFKNTYSEYSDENFQSFSLSLFVFVCSYAK